MSESQSCIILIAATPPSLNEVGFHTHARKGARIKREWQSLLETELMASTLPKPIPGGRVEVTATLFFPTRRRRDEGNFRALLEKSCGDALTFSGDPTRPNRLRYLLDDTPDRYEFGRLLFAVQPKSSPATMLVFRWDS